MKKGLLSLFLCALCLTGIQAAKTVYIPNEWRNSGDSLLYSETDTQNRYTWSKSRSRETDNVIVFWDKGYGSTAPDKLSKSNTYYVDINDLLAKAEAFYELECSTLGFVDPTTSNISKYKVMILMNHTTEWTCYGGGYDFQVPALWLNPATCKPVGHSVAHEVGHSFHYMCYAEDSNHGALSNIQTGFHGAVGNGQTIWEQTAQWQANQSYPELMFDQSISVFQYSHNLAFTHEWHRYQSYWFHYYLCQHYGDIKTVANVWNQRETSVKDFNQALMDLKGLSVSDLYGLYFDYAMRCVTWDFDVAASYRDDYVGQFTYNAVKVGSQKYQVAYASCPQSTGFNVIELKVPSSGTIVTTAFTALSPGSSLATNDPAKYLNGETQWTSSGRSKYNTAVSASTRGFRVGYVALLKDGTRQYFNDNARHCTGTGKVTEEITMKVPANTSRLWLVVSPAPSSYIQHKWDENYANDDQWPYQFELTGTDCKGSYPIGTEPDATTVEDIETTFRYDLALPQATDYTPVTQAFGEEELAALGFTSLDDLSSAAVTWSADGPSAGQAMFYAETSDGDLENSGSTANGYGHWFNGEGTVIAYGDESKIYSECYPEAGIFNIGQFPGKVSVGDDFTIRQAWVVNDGTRRLIAHFVFHVTIGNELVIPEITLPDTDTEYNHEDGQHIVTLSRALPSGRWLSFCAPFNISKAQQEEMGIAESKEMKSVALEDGTLVVTFGDIADGGEADQMIREYKPCLIRMAEDKDGLTLKDWYDNLKTPELSVSTSDNAFSVTSYGSFIQTQLPQNAYYLEGGVLRHALTAQTTLRGWRSYFVFDGTLPTSLLGDVNRDGSVTIADVTALVNIILGKTADAETRLADVNEDGSVTIADVTALVNIILGKAELKQVDNIRFVIDDETLSPGADDTDGTGLPD